MFGTATGSCYRISYSATRCHENLQEIGGVEFEAKNGEEKVRICGVKVELGR